MHVEIQLARRCVCKAWGTRQSRGWEVAALRVTRGRGSRDRCPCIYTETALGTVLFFPHDLISAAGSFVLQTSFLYVAQENIIRDCHVVFLYESVLYVD